MSFNYGHDVAYTARNVIGTVVYLKDGTPVYVVDVTDKNDVQYNLIGSRKVQQARMDDLDLSSVRLGYMFDGHQAHYYMRRPERQWRQGLTDKTMIKYSEGRMRATDIHVTDRRMDAVYRGIYPSVTKCLETLSEEPLNVRSTPFCRTYAISRDDVALPKLGIYRKTVRVGASQLGSYDEFVKNIQLLPQFAYLNEELLNELEKNR